jgi:lipopolysaccharide export system permease protein
MSVCEMDSMYQKALHEEEISRAEVAGAMLTGVHMAATGVRGPTVPTPPQRSRRTVGALYCRLVQGISPAIEPAEAAEPQARAQQRAQQPSPRPAVPRPPMAPGQRVGSPSSGAQGPHVPYVVDADSPGRAAAQARASFGQTLSRIQIASARVSDAQRTASRYAVEIQKKFALAAACAVFVLLGAPIGLRSPRGGVGMVLGVSIGVFGLYYVFLVAGEAMANRLVLTPFWGMWMANVLYTAMGAVLMVRVQRSGATARSSDWRERLTLAREWWALRRAARRAALGATARSG